MNAEHPCRCDRTVVIQQKYEAHSTPDQTELQGAFLVQRSVQPGRHGIRTILRMAANANGIAAQAFDLVMTALRLHLDPGTGCQAVAIHLSVDRTPAAIEINNFAAGLNDIGPTLIARVDHARPVALTARLTSDRFKTNS